MIRTIGLVCALLCVAPIGSAQGSFETVPFPQREALLAAMRIEDPQERTLAVDDVLHEVLVRGDAQTRFAATDHILRLSRWYDFRPHESVFYQALERYGNWTLVYMLDIQDLMLGDRGKLITALKRALVEDRIELPHGRPLDRNSAIRWVGREGITELRALAEQSYPTLSPQSQESYPLEKFWLEFELGKGARNREDVYVKTADHLLAMDSAELHERANTEDLLAHIITDRVRQACERNPIDYSRNKACDMFYTLWQRQNAFLAKGEGVEPERNPHLPTNPKGWLAKTLYWTLSARQDAPTLPLPVATPRYR